MPSIQIKELRQAGKLQEALQMAESEWKSDPENEWTKRNISWVYYDLIKECIDRVDEEGVIDWLNRLAEITFINKEEMLFNSIALQMGRACFAFGKARKSEVLSKQLLGIISRFSFPKPGIQYSYLLKGLHYFYKENEQYEEMIDWWGLENLQEDDYRKEGEENQFISIAEQVYSTYAKNLLPEWDNFGRKSFDRDKVERFLPDLLIKLKQHDEWVFPPYYSTKLLLELGDREKAREYFIPFARKKKNDFWVWDLFAEMCDESVVEAIYARALLCPAKPEMLINIRRKLARILIQQEGWKEAKTEIDLILKVKKERGFQITSEESSWTSQEWYPSVEGKVNNRQFYESHRSTAEAILYSDIPEEFIVVESVNLEKGMLHFIHENGTQGFFKFSKLIDDVYAGDILRLRFSEAVKEGYNQILTATRAKNEKIEREYLKSVSGVVKGSVNKPHGFISDVFIPPMLMKKLGLKDGVLYSGKAIKTYQADKQRWGWKLLG